MRKMGGLRKYLPITYATVLIGAWANSGLPPFAGFFSKDTIIEAIGLSHVPGAAFAYLAALGGVLAGGFYSFRLVFFAFHGKERFDTHGGHGHGHDAHAHGDDHAHGHGGAPHESPWVVTLPLILLAIPSIAAGWWIGDFVFGDYFGNAIYIAPEHEGLAQLKEEFHGVLPMIMHSVASVPFWLALGGAAAAWFLYIVRPDLPAVLRERLGPIVSVLEDGYGIDRLYSWLFAGGARNLGGVLWRVGDVKIIDGLFVNGSAAAVGWFSTVIRRLQTGYIYHYAIAMIAGILGLLTFMLSR